MQKETLKRIRKWFSRLLSLALTIYIIYYIIQNHEHFKVITSLGVPEIMGLFLVILVTTLVSAQRLLLVMKYFDLQEISFSRWFRIFILARFLNRLVPQGGNLYRALTLKKEKGFSLKNYTLSFIGFTWIDLLVTFSLISIVLYGYQPTLSIGKINLMYASIAAVIILIITALIYFRRPSAVKMDWGLLWRNIMLCMITFGLSLLWFYLGFRSVHVSIPIGALAVFTAIIRMGLIVTITPGNIGVLELAYGTLSSALGFNFATGVMVAAVTRAVSFCSVLLLGALMGGLPMIAKIKKEKMKKKE